MQAITSDTVIAYITHDEQPNTAGSEATWWLGFPAHVLVAGIRNATSAQAFPF